MKKVGIGKIEVKWNKSRETTLREETFAGRNFREFREFWPFSRKLMTRNFQKDPIRES